MALIPISEDTLINPDRIDTVEIREIGSVKTIVIVVGGQAYVPSDKFLNKILPILIAKGGGDLSKQFFSV